MLSRALPLSFFLASKLIRLNRIRILPQTTSRSARLGFSFGVSVAVFRRLLVFVELVMPRHAGFDLFEVDVSSVQNNLAYKSPVLIDLLITYAHIFAKYHFRKAQSGLLAENLMRLRCIDARESDAMLRVRGIKNRNRVAVSNRNHATGQFLPA